MVRCRRWPVGSPRSGCCLGAAGYALVHASEVLPIIAHPAARCLLHPWWLRSGRCSRACCTSTGSPTSRTGSGARTTSCAGSRSCPTATSALSERRRSLSRSSWSLLRSRRFWRSPHELPLLLVPALARFSATAGCWFGTPAREGGLGRSVMARPTVLGAVPALVVLAVVLAALVGRLRCWRERLFGGLGLVLALGHPPRARGTVRRRHRRRAGRERAADRDHPVCRIRDGVVSAMHETVLLIVRHPETEANINGRFVGQGESPYTAEGRRQARRLPRKLARFRPDVVWSSPLRARAGRRAAHEPARGRTASTWTSA